MHASSTLPNVRRVTIAVCAALLLSGLTAAPAGAATVVKSHGTVGAWSVRDKITKPGGQCPYQGAAGTYYLDRVHVRGPKMYGTRHGLRSVGYRLLLQRHTSNGWKTAQRGSLISSPASISSPVRLPGSKVVRNPDKAPNAGRYRAAMKLIWWDKHAQVQGALVAKLQHHRRSYDRSVGHTCAGRVPIPH